MFWARVQRGGPDECWPWRGAVDKDGYGYVSFKDRNRRAARFAFFVTHGRWPRGLTRHTCDNPPCVNPGHLLEGTPADNMADKMARGRHRSLRGEAVSRLTEADVRAIRDEGAVYLTTSRGGRCGVLTALAQRFGISIGSVGDIIRRRTWAHVV